MIINKMSSNFISEFFQLLLQDLVFLYLESELSLRVGQLHLEFLELNKEIIKYLSNSEGQWVLP